MKSFWVQIKDLQKYILNLKNIKKSLYFLEKAIKRIELLRGKMVTKELKSSFLSSKIDVYEKMVNLLYKLHSMDPDKGYNKKVLNYIEKAKARAFLDNLQEGKINFKKKLSEKHKYEDYIISRKISALQIKLSKPGLNIQKREKHIKALSVQEDNYQNLIIQIKKKNPEYSKLVYQEPIKLEKIQKNILPDDAAVVEYFTAEDQLFIVFVSVNEFSIHKIEGSNIILDRVSIYIELLSNKETGSFIGVKAGLKLYKNLIGPVKDKFKKHKKNNIYPGQKFTLSSF